MLLYSIFKVVIVAESLMMVSTSDDVNHGVVGHSESISNGRNLGENYGFV